MVWFCFTFDAEVLEDLDQILGSDTRTMEEFATGKSVKGMKSGEFVSIPEIEDVPSQKIIVKNETYYVTEDADKFVDKDLISLKALMIVREQSL